MARELTDAELAAHPEAALRRNLKHQAELDRVNVHVVARENIRFDLDGKVWVSGRGTATAEEVAAAEARFPVMAELRNFFGAQRAKSRPPEVREPGKPRLADIVKSDAAAKAGDHVA